MQISYSRQQPGTVAARAGTKRPDGENGSTAQHHEGGDPRRGARAPPWEDGRDKHLRSRALRWGKVGF